MISAISVKDRIKNKAVSCSISVNDLLQAYGLERTVYRISVSEFSDRFTLKGGIFLYALFDGEFARATRDIDLLAYSMSNNEDNMKQVSFREKQELSSRSKAGDSYFLFPSLQLQVA